MIPISTPLLGEEEQAAVERVMRSGMLAQGPQVAAFERAFADFIGVKHAIATSNGTTALHAALLAHGIGPGDEVITTPFTFIASANAILYAGARPVFVDIDAYFNIDADQVEAAITERTRAIMPVHLFGLPADLRAIGEIARHYGLTLVEDACQAHGATFDGRKVGSFGTGCFSFYATKNMTTGEGGMITTDDDQAALNARQIINHGMRRRYFHEIRGYNYRMTDLAAAIGVEQLKKLPAFNARRIENARFFNQHLAGIPGITLPDVAPERTHVYHQYTLQVAPDASVSRDALVTALGAAGVGTGIYYPVPVHRQEALGGLPLGNACFPVAERMSNEVLAIPVHPGVTELERIQIVECIANAAGVPQQPREEAASLAVGFPPPSFAGAS